jgi:hypothetical protein
MQTSMAFASYSLACFSASHRSAPFSLGRRRRRPPRCLRAEGPVASFRVQTCCIRCCAASHEEEKGGERGQNNSSARNSRPPHPSWSDTIPPAPQSSSASSSAERYGGWSPVDDPDASSWRAGLLRVGAGFVLALGISLVSYLVYTKQGRRLEMAPTITQEQQTSSSTKSQLSHDQNENGETSRELAAKNLDGDLREESNHDMQKDTEQGVQTPEQEPAVGSATEVHKKKVAVAPGWFLLGSIHLVFLFYCHNKCSTRFQ